MTSIIINSILCAAVVVVVVVPLVWAMLTQKRDLATGTVTARPQPSVTPARRARSRATHIPQPHSGGVRPFQPLPKS